MKKNLAILYSSRLLLIICLASSCSDNVTKKIPPSENPEPKNIASSKKPPSSYQDTLVIKNSAAVFYHPDSIQLEKIRKLIDSNVFNATIHEYYYQMRNARIVIHKNWPSVRIIEAKNVRYLLFEKKITGAELVDLDSRGDPYGLFLFDGQKGAAIADMMNIDSELSRYFNKRQ
jgi:hypothetical protein